MREIKAGGRLRCEHWYNSPSHQANPHIHQQQIVWATTFQSGLPQPLSSQIANASQLIQLFSSFHNASLDRWENVWRLKSAIQSLPSRTFLKCLLVRFRTRRAVHSQTLPRIFRFECVLGKDGHMAIPWTSRKKCQDEGTVCNKFPTFSLSEDYNYAHIQYFPDPFWSHNYMRQRLLCFCNRKQSCWACALSQ